MTTAPVASAEDRAAPETPEPEPGGVAIRFTDVSKTFRIPVDRPHTLKERVLRPRSSRAANELEALKNVSFEIEKGEFFGVIGRNGSGKSTLLKCLAGIYQPTSGKVEIAGRVSPFLELGVGFSPELTALENVVLNASLIGIPPRLARESFDEIIAFAELEEFVDLKFKNYSSGMMMRLAFASAIQADTGILLIDEALAVGDEPFKEKCYREFDRMKESGRTIVFVTHALALVNRYCDRAMLLDKGEQIALDESRPVVALYQQRNKALAEAKKAQDESRNGKTGEETAASPPKAGASPSKAGAAAAASKPAADEPRPALDATQVVVAAAAAAVAATAPASPAPAAPPQREVEPATEPNVVAEPPPAHAEPTPGLPAGTAAVVGAWTQDRRGRLVPMSETLSSGTLHVRASFPAAHDVPAFGVIIKGATGEPVEVEHTLRHDLKPGMPARHPDTPYTLRFYVHAGPDLYIASVAVRAPGHAALADEPPDDALAFSVYGTRLTREESAHQPLTAPPSAELTLGGPQVPTLGDAWLEGPRGERDRSFHQHHDAKLYASLALPGGEQKTAGPAQAPSTAAPGPYAIKLYAYTEAGQYQTSVAISLR